MDRRTDYEKLDDVLIPHRNSGKPIMRIGVQAQFYFPNGAEPQVRTSAMDALAAYARLAGPHVTRILPSGASRLVALAKADFPARQRKQASEVEAGTVFGITLTDEEQPPCWNGVAQLVGDYAPDKLSYLYTAVPASFMKEDPNGYVEAVVEWASILRPDYGTAGFALVPEPGMELQWPHESWPILSRFCGFDLLGAFNLNEKPGRIQAVNWLTVLGDAALAAIGGRARLEARLAQAWADIAQTALPRDFVLHDFAGGIVIRAGRYPQMGDCKAEGAPETYRAVNAALRPIIFNGYRDRPGDLIKLSAERDRYAETLNWIFRFDGEGCSTSAAEPTTEVI